MLLGVLYIILGMRSDSLTAFDCIHICRHVTIMILKLPPKFQVPFPTPYELWLLLTDFILFQLWATSYAVGRCPITAEARLNSRPSHVLVCLQRLESSDNFLDCIQLQSARRGRC